MNNRGSALIVSMVLTLLLSLMIGMLLEKIIPSSRQIRGIENATAASYLAEGALEEALGRVNKYFPGTYSGSVEELDTSNTSSRGFSFVLSGTIIPSPGLGTSEYDSNWNRISEGKPVQFIIPSGMDISMVEVDFRVPDFVQGASPTPFSDPLRTLSGGSFDTTALINWTLSESGSSTRALMPDTTKPLNQALFTNEHVNVFPVGSTGRISSFLAKNINGDMVGSVALLANTVLNNCANTCILKLSLAHPLSNNLSHHDPIPYLEYRVRGSSAETAPLPNTIPLQYGSISTEGYAYGYKQSLLKNILQLTTSEALDFAVFQ